MPYRYTLYIHRIYIYFYTDIKVKNMTDKYTYIDIEITVFPV